MKVLLLRPPAGQYEDSFSKKHAFMPLGICYLASYLEKHGHQCDLIDLYVEKIKDADFIKKINEISPDLIGISFLTESRFTAKKLAEFVKSHFPDIPIVAGGPHPSLTVEDTMENIKAIDYIVIGEGEVPLLMLAEILSNGNKDLQKIPNLTYRIHNKIVQNKGCDKALIKALDSEPLPAREKLQHHLYHGQIEQGIHKGTAAGVITGRGCPIGCNFCASSILSPHYRYRNVSSVINELERIVSDSGTENIWFFDDTFTFNKKRVQDICQEIIKKNLKINYVIHARIDTVDYHTIKLLKESGCVQIRFGVESGSQKMIDHVIHKKIDLRDVKQVAKLAEKVEIEAKFSFILSHPGETIEDATSTMQLIEELKQYRGIKTALNIMRIYPGTDIERIAKNNGVLKNTHSWYLRDEDLQSFYEVYGDVPLYIEKMDLQTLSKFLFQWAKLEKYPFYKMIPSAIKSIKKLDDVRRLFNMFQGYICSKI